MPLARIVTSTPALHAGLAEFLRSRGYTVEWAEPGELRAAPAELEMDLEGCSPEEAMTRGMSAAGSARSHGQRRAIAYDITGRPVAFADEDEEPAPQRGSVFTEMWRGAASAARQLRDDLRLSAGRLRAWLAEGQESIRQHRAHYQQARRQAQAEKARRRQAALAAQHLRLQQQAAAARRVAEERARQAREEAVRSGELAAERARLREQQEPARAEQESRRERQLTGQFRREARLDTVRERFQVEQSQARHRIEPAEEVLARRQVRRPRPVRHQRDDDWKMAAAAAIVIALLATLGYAAYENRQPAAPLSNRTLVRSQNVSQPVPFGAATVLPPQAAPAAVPARLPQGEVAPAPRVQRARRSRPADDTVANDEVVIHRSAPAPSRITTSSSTARHISDLEQ